MSQKIAQARHKILMFIHKHKVANNIIDITQSQNICREEKISKTLEEK